MDIVLVRVVPQLEMGAEELARGDPPEPGRVLLRGVPAVSPVHEEEDEVKRHSNRIQVRNNTQSSAPFVKNQVVRLLVSQNRYFMK